MNNLRMALAAGLTALALVGCATPPEPATPTTEAPPATPAESYLACLVTDADQGADGSPIVGALNGLDRAQLELGIETSHVTAADQADYAGLLMAQVDAGCDIVVGLGTPMADAMEAAAKANPATQFALVDATPNSAPANLRPVLFSAHESGFLGGYLAAANSQSGKVGTFGSLSVPAVTIYMDGFVQGVDHYNQANQAEVEALGWSLEAQDGTFVRSDSAPQDDPAAGWVAAQSLVDEGADVIMAVAGHSGTGALELASQSEALRIIWSDTDGCLTQPQYCNQLLGSVVKDRAAAVFEVIQTDHAGNSAAGIFAANLRNAGTGLLAGADGQFPNEIGSELDSLREQVIEGTITVNSPSSIA
ncbi:MAG: BMP family ABC transporter substrate-binding protein [Brooklawnia sp.]|jgi:basic membrane protein A